MGLTEAVKPFVNTGKIISIIILICLIIYAQQPGIYVKFKIWMEHMSRK